MRARIAEILDLDIARVAVKATTTEGLGFTGRRRRHCRNRCRNRGLAVT